jgi:hypothetical protein
MNLSFAMTKDLLPPKGSKKETRRFMKPTQFQRWLNAYQNPNKIHDAYDMAPRNGGQKIGQFVLTDKPFWQPLSDMDVNAVAREGRSDLLDSDDPVKEFILLYFVRPKPTWNQDKINAAYHAKLQDSCVVLRFDFQPSIINQLVIL